MFVQQSKAPYVCARCLRARRQYSTPANATVPPPPPLASGAAKLTNRRLLSVYGDDAPKFLQGIISNNVRPEPGSGFYAAFLTALGKVLNDVFIYPTSGTQWHIDQDRGGKQGYLVEVDAGEAESLYKHLKKHKLRSNLTLRLLEAGELDVWSVWREDERWTAHGRAVLEDGILGLMDCRAPGMGQRVLLRPGDAVGEVDEAPESAYTIRRYLRGVPEGQKEIPWNDSLPMNHNIDIMGGIDFKKGCYLGQELTIRTHHTGVVRRRILPVALYAHEGLPPDTLEYDPGASIRTVKAGTEIRRDDQRRRPTAKLIGSVGNVGLGMCRLEQMSDLTVSAEGSSYSPDDRFLLETSSGQELGVKAFVPDWIRGRVREPKLQKRVE